MIYYKSMEFVQRRANAINEYTNTHPSGELDVLGQPLETFGVTLSHDDGAHEDLDRSDVRAQVAAASAGGLQQVEGVLHFVLAHGLWRVDLVTQDEERNVLQLRHGQERVQLFLGLCESLWICHVNQIHDTVDLWEVVLPQSSGLLMSTQVEGRESDVTNGQLLAGRMQRWL